MGFSTHVLCFIYQQSEYIYEQIQMCGDINNKHGKLMYRVQSIITLDGVTDIYGSVFLLLDAKCCKINGGIALEYDNYMFVGLRWGRSNVDYYVIL